MTGFGISTNRAVIMMCFSLIASYLGRSYDAWTAMAFSGIVILLQKPYAVFSCSFLLSYSATGGMLLISPLLKSILEIGSDKKKRQKKRRKKEFAANHSPLENYLYTGIQYVIKKSGELLIASVSIWLASLPVMLYFFYEFPTYGILMNLFVLSLAPVLVITAFFGGIAGIFFLPAAKFLLLPAHWILLFYQKICALFLSLPSPIQVIGRPTPIKMIIYYGILASVLFFFHQYSHQLPCDRQWSIKPILQWIAGHFTHRHNQCQAAISSINTASPEASCTLYKGIALCLIGFSLFLLCHRPLPDKLQITLLDVGQGDCIFIRTDTGKTILIDGGSTSVSQVGKYRMIPFLKYHGISRIDYMIMTHEDEDHISGQMELLAPANRRGIAIGYCLLPEPSWESTGKGYVLFQKAATAADVPISYIHKGDCLRLGSLSLTCLHPEQGFPARSANAYSTTLSLHYGSFSMLLTGDLENEGEEVLQKELEEKAPAGGYTVLKVAHHGSKNSTSQELLNIISPEISLISCGKNNRYGHPHKELMERLIQTGGTILQTSLEGAVSLKTDGKTITRKSFLKETT